METVNCLINDHFFHRMDLFIFSNSKLKKACFNQLARADVMQSYTIEPPSNNIEELYRTYKPHLFAITYRMLGSRSDAEDMVQDLFINMHGFLNDNIQNYKDNSEPGGTASPSPTESSAPKKF
jgi:hypothetical protein